MNRRTNHPQASTTQHEGVLVIETDGVMVRYRDRQLDGGLEDSDWHEVKVGLAGGWQPRSGWFDDVSLMPLALDVHFTPPAWTTLACVDRLGWHR